MQPRNCIDNTEPSAWVGISLCSWLDSARTCLVSAAEAKNKHNFQGPFKTCLPQKAAKQLTHH